MSNLTPEQIDVADKKLREVFSALGFTVKMQEEPHRWNVRLWATKEDLTIIADQGWNQDKRITFHGVLPKSDNASHYGIKVDNITVSAEKSVEQIVKDVQRRFLPAYLKAVEAARERNQNAENYEKAKTQALRIVRGEPLNVEEAKSGSWSFYVDREGQSALYGDVKASDDSVSLNIHNVKPEVARKIVELLGVK